MSFFLPDNILQIEVGKKRLDAIKNEIDGNIKFNTLLENLKLFFEELNYSI